MMDLPNSGLFQQQHARPKTGEELEVLGKTAASKWLNGSSKTLSDAVIETVKHAHLSPEQVKRVCEFANTDAFIREFKKESSVGHKVVDFEGGPADPAAVLQDLNDGGGGSVFDAGNGDYKAVPEEKQASASAEEEIALERLFATPGGVIPFEQPLGDVMDMRDKLAGAFDHLSSELSGLEIMVEDLTERLYYQVKQAALSGSSLGEVSQVMEVGCSDPEVMKVAFQIMTPRLLKDGVYTSIDDAVSSMDKIASNRIVNKGHPLAKLASEFAEALVHSAQVRAAREQVKEAHVQATNFIKAAGKEGILLRAGKAVRETAHKAAPRAGEAAKKVVEKLIHEDHGDKAKRVVEGLVRNAPVLAGGAAVLEGARRASNNPVINRVYHGAQAHLNPLSQDWDYETYRQQGGQ